MLESPDNITYAGNASWCMQHIGTKDVRNIRPKKALMLSDLAAFSYRKHGFCLTCGAQHCLPLCRHAPDQDGRILA